METLFLEARKNQNILIPKNEINKLPKSIALVSTVQYLDSLKIIKTLIEETKRKIILLKGTHSCYQGQILGCSEFNNDKLENIGAILYIGDGLFHPKQLMFKTNKDVFILKNNEISKLNEKDIEKIKNKVKAGLTKFFTSDKIGVLISLKPGQQRLKQALELKTKFPKKDFFLLLSNTLNFNELENFPFIECYINTMCPRIGYDDSIRLRKPVVNIDEVESLVKN